MTSYLLILALLLGLAPAFIAYGKGRNFLFWWIYGVVLGPVALIHAIMLRGGRHPALETAPETRRARSDSPWPLLLRVASLFAIAIIAVAGYRIIVPPETGKPELQREIVVSSDRTPPGQEDVASKDAGGSDRAAPAAPPAPAVEAPAAETPPRPSPNVRVTVRQDRIPPEDVAAKQAPAAETRPTERDTSTAPDTDKAAAPPPPPPAPTPPQLERTQPLDPVKDVRELAARTAPAEPYVPSETRRKPVTAKPSKTAPPARPAPAKSTKVAAKPSAAAPKPAAPEKPSLSEVTAMGEMVLAVQHALTKRGYDPGPANGLAGRETENAIRKFQADRGLKRTGTIDYEVLQALDIVGPRVFAFQPPPGATSGR